MAYYRLHPFGQEISDYLLCQQTAIMNNRWRNKTEEPLTADELMPKMTKPQTPHQMQHVLRNVLDAVSKNHRR